MARVIGPDVGRAEPSSKIVYPVLTGPGNHERRRPWRSPVFPPGWAIECFSGSWTEDSALVSGVGIPSVTKGDRQHSPSPCLIHSFSVPTPRNVPQQLRQGGSSSLILGWRWVYVGYGFSSTNIWECMMFPQMRLTIFGLFASERRNSAVCIPLFQHYPAAKNPRTLCLVGFSKRFHPPGSTQRTRLLASSILAARTR